MKHCLSRFVLCATALFSLSLAVYGQTPSAPSTPGTTAGTPGGTAVPTSGTGGNATASPSTPATTAPAPAAAQTPTPKVPSVDTNSPIVNETGVSGAFKVTNVANAALTPDQAGRGDTAWMIVATALVMLMTPGLAFFYGGLVRSKNVLNTLMMSFVALGIISIQWMLWGFSVAFGPHDVHGLFASFWQKDDYLGLQNVGSAPVAPNVIPESIFMLFQMTFAIITPALISGAIAERMKFSAYCLFILLWATFFYDPLAHNVWGGGFIGTGHMHALDFAGGTVVHISSGVSALTLAIMLGKRRGHGSEEMRPHNVPFVLLGAALLWFGWFGFNAGSELAADGVACSAFINTHIATAAAAMSWILIEWMRFKKPTAVGFASGAVAGLVAITPACGFVTPFSALLIGLIVSPICFSAIQMKSKLNKYDDALDVFGVHACGGMWGALATGLFATDKINTNITNTNTAAGGLGAVNGPFGGGGLMNWHQPLIQIGAILITVVCAVISTVVIGKVVGLVTGGLRSSSDEEEDGLDVTDHGEVGYSGESGGIPALAGVD